MKRDPDNSSAIAEAAAQWLARHDRGLTPEEARDFERWLAADARHRAEWQSLDGSWQALDALPGCSELAAEAARLDRDTRRRLWLRRAFLGVTAAAAALAIGFVAFKTDVFTRHAAPAAPTIVRVAADAHRQTLADGSMVETRGDAVVAVDFSPAIRRVRLERGEAFFTVAHDTARPFIVEVDGVAVRAVGTAFVVRRDAAGVDVLVTEGKVRVGAPTPAVLEAAPLFEAGSAARVETASGAAAVEKRAIEPGELERALVWRSPALDFSGAPLDQVLEAFREYAPHRVKLGDAALRRRTLTGIFQADNIEGFLRLAPTFDLRVERTANGDILLLPANP